MPAEPQILFRVVCGRRAHSAWMETERDAFKVAIDKGLASADRSGKIYFGPLVWIEVGRRSRSKARAVPVENVDKLPLRNRPVWQPGGAVA